MSDFTAFQYPLIIREHHLDIFNHVNNATYLQILEEARWEFLYARGFDLPTIQALGVGPVVLEITIQFLKELTLRQSIIIESKMLTYKEKIGIMKQDILGKDNTLFCHAQLTFGLMDMTTRKLVQPSEHWLLVMGKK